VSALLLALAAVAGAALIGWARERQRRHAAERRMREEVGRHARERETEAQEQAERTAALFDRMVEGLIVVDASDRIRLANRAAGALFQFEPAAAAGRSLLEAVRHHAVAALAARLDAEPEILGHELRIEATAPGAPARFLQINALALKGAGGGREGAILVFHDLTRLRQLEAVRQEFVANVSHELRTPLSLIKSAVETLLDGGKEDPATLQRFLQIVERHANRLALLIDDLLMLSTLDAGTLRLEIDAVPLRAAVQEVMDDYAARAAARQVALVNETPAAIGVRADPERLRQVLSNLVDNAIKYGRSDGTVRAGARTLADGRIEVTVCDDGPGITAEAQARIFERFYRADKARSREQGGTGLGLAIVKHVVQAHGGDVAVRSAPGQGAAFSFTLRAAA
jgi:two-component system phosphate regulon sensor histidine kinase PhoR